MAAPDDIRPTTDGTGGTEADRVPAVICSHVDIRYRVFGHSGTGADTVHENVEASAAKRLLARVRGANTGLGMREVHAVKDVSFVAYRGEAVGLIGRNGSGKSTILRSIAGLVPPTGGNIWINGTAALLGVGAVLLPKLSGRRNVEIGLLAQGLTPAEVADLVPQVIEFADIGEFIDLPMHTYSSGMGARLRFAISTAVVPDILVVDEALSTGDAQFKERATARIAEIQEQAGTIFMVTHNAKTIQQVCTRALWMDEGRLLADGEPGPVVGLYGRKYGKDRALWRQRYQEMQQVIDNEGLEAARELLRRWEPEGGW